MDNLIKNRVKKNVRKTLKKFDKKIPQSWEEISVKKQLEYERLFPLHPEFKILVAVSAYCDVPLDDVKKMSVPELKEALDSMPFILQPLPTDPIDHFEYMGETYWVTESLLKNEVQDFLSLEAVKGKPDELLYQIAIYCKKKGESLNDYVLEDRAKHFENLPITIANRLRSFFLSTTILFSVGSQKTLEDLNSNLKESFDYINSILRKQGSGRLSTRLPIRILRSSIKSLERSWRKYYGSLLLETEKENWTKKLMRFKWKKQNAKQS